MMDYDDELESIEPGDDVEDEAAAPGNEPASDKLKTFLDVLEAANRQAGLEGLIGLGDGSPEEFATIENLRDGWRGSKTYEYLTIGTQVWRSDAQPEDDWYGVSMLAGSIRIASNEFFGPNKSEDIFETRKIQSDYNREIRDWVNSQSETVSETMERLRKQGFTCDRSQENDERATGANLSLGIVFAVIVTEGLIRDTTRWRDVHEAIASLTYLNSKTYSDFGDGYDYPDLDPDNPPKFDLGDQSPGEFVAQIAVDPDKLIAGARRWEMSGRNLAILPNLGSVKDRQGGDKSVEFLIDDLIPKGTVTLVAGAPGVGKSTMLHELAIKVASIEPDENESWLGQEINAAASQGVVVYIAGEDNEEMTNDRERKIDPDGRASRILLLPEDGRPFREILNEFLVPITDVSLVIVDPVRKYLEGDEDGSDSTNQFFKTIENIIQQKNCAAIVSHHLLKNARPMTVQSVKPLIRGSGVFLDRPRVILGVVRNGERTKIGVVKWNMIKACVLSEEGREFMRDEDTLWHLPVERTVDSRASDAATLDESSRDAIDRVLRAVLERSTSDRKITRTGKNGLFQARMEILKGLTRVKVTKALDVLIDDGRLNIRDGQIFVAE